MHSFTKMLGCSLMMFLIKFRSNGKIPQEKSDRFKSAKKKNLSTVNNHQNGNTGNRKASHGSPQAVHSNQ